MSNAGRKPEVDDATQDAGRASMTTGNGDVGEALQGDHVDTAAEPAIDHRIQSHLGRKLKEAYEELVREPVPDRFRQLLDELERKENKQ